MTTDFLCSSNCAAHGNFEPISADQFILGMNGSRSHYVRSANTMGYSVRATVILEAENRRFP